LIDPRQKRENEPEQPPLILEKQAVELRLIHNP
jgi:hypothetical protein